MGDNAAGADFRHVVPGTRIGPTAVVRECPVSGSQNIFQPYALASLA